MKKTVEKDKDYTLSIENEMAKIDQKDRGFYDSLTPEQRKKFSPYILLKWGASVYGSADLSSYYLMAFNQNVNKHFFDIGSKHPKLQWLSITTCSPNMGKQKHYWINATSKKANGKLEKRISEKFPEMKLDDIRLMLEINSPDDIIKWLEENGMSEKEMDKLI